MTLLPGNADRDPEALPHEGIDEFKALLAAHKTGVIIVPSEEELLKSVESIPGAVGLVDVYSINGTCARVLKVDGKLPLEQGYFLKATSKPDRRQSFVCATGSGRIAKGVGSWVRTNFAFWFR